MHIRIRLSGTNGCKHLVKITSEDLLATIRRRRCGNNVG